MPTTNAMTQPSRGPALWGAVFGGRQAASPLASWWLDPATVYALGLALIASVYIGFAVADGRQSRVVVESGVATIFVVVAAAGVTGSAWLLVVGLGGHGLKDLWQHRTKFVAVMLRPARPSASAAPSDEAARPPTRTRSASGAKPSAWLTRSISALTPSR